MVIDGDLVVDIEKMQLPTSQVKTVTFTLVRWLVWQINTIIRRKRVALLEKKPGSVLGCATKMVFMRMLRRVGKYQEGSHIDKIDSLRAGFNDALNDVVAKIGHYMLTINSCNSYEHYDRAGKLSISGKTNFWCELDELIDRFDANRIKLLPAPKNPARFNHNLQRGNHTGASSSSYHWHSAEQAGSSQVEEYFTMRSRYKNTNQ